MTEKTFGVLKNNEDLSPYIDKFQDNEIFDEIEKLAENKKENLEEIGNQIADFIARSLLLNIYLEFVNNSSLNKINDFTIKLISPKSGIDKIALIDEQFSSKKDTFWKKVEGTLHEFFLNPLLKRLKE